MDWFDRAAAFVEAIGWVDRFPGNLFTAPARAACLHIVGDAPHQDVVCGWPALW